MLKPPVCDCFTESAPHPFGRAGPKAGNEMEGVIFFYKKYKMGLLFCKKSGKWRGVFCKKWTFPQRRVHYVQYQYFLFYILLMEREGKEKVKGARKGKRSGGKENGTKGREEEGTGKEKKKNGRERGGILCSCDFSLGKTLGWIRRHPIMGRCRQCVFDLSSWLCVRDYVHSPTWFSAIGV